MTRHFFDRPIRIDPQDLRIFDRYRPIIDDWQGFLDSLHIPLPFTMWTNTLRTTPTDLQKLLHTEGIAVSPISWNLGAFSWQTPEERTGSTIAYQAGMYHVQEEVSMLSGFLLDAKPHERVLDMCAAPGNKTAQIAIQMQNTGTLIANDRSIGRIKAMRRVLERLGIHNTTLLCEDAGNLPKRSGPYDRIMVDVPCSCEGTSRKNPGIFKKLCGLPYEQLGGLQRAILRKAILLCKPGGRIVYSTCTYAPEENECVIDHVLQQYSPDTLRIVPIHIPHLTTAPGLTAWKGQVLDPRLQHAARIYPHLNNTGGFFVCIIEKALPIEDDEPTTTHTTAITAITTQPPPFEHPTPSEQTQPHTNTTLTEQPHTNTTPREQAQARMDAIALPDAAPYLALLEQRFGIPPATFSDLRLLQTSNKVITATCRDHLPPVRPKPEIIGAPFMRCNSSQPKITTNAILTFGRFASKHVIDLTLEEAHQYIRRIPLTLTPQHLQHIQHHGYVILRCNGMILGLGIFRGNAEGGILESQFPKSWMFQHESTENTENTESDQRESTNHDQRESHAS